VAFPTVVETLTQEDPALAGSVDVSIGSSFVAGDLLLIGVAQGGSSSTQFATVSGWDQIVIDDINSAGSVAWYKRKCTGGESSPVNIVVGTGSVSRRFVTIFLRIDKDTWSGDIDEVEVGTDNEGLSDTAALLGAVASWGVEENLFLAWSAWDDSTAASVGYPTDFDDNQHALENSNSSGCRLVVCTQELESDDADPDEFTFTGDDEQWTSGCMVIRPAGEAPPPSGTPPLASHHYRMRRAA
jgi:hypothetical protein